MKSVLFISSCLLLFCVSASIMTKNVCPDCKRVVTFSGGEKVLYDSVSLDRATQKVTVYYRRQGKYVAETVFPSKFITNTETTNPKALEILTKAKTDASKNLYISKK